MNRFILSLAIAAFSISALALAQQSNAERRVLRDVSYGFHRLQKMDVYLTSQKNAPIILFAHGGAWQTGDKGNRSHRYKGQFFSSAGFLFISTNYRLSPEVSHPAHIDDMAKSLAFIIKTCSHWGGDKKRVFLMGHSAGAHLVALLTTNREKLKEHGLSPRHITGTILLDGAGYDIPLTKKYNHWSFARLYEQAFGNDDKILADASPIYHCKGRGLAPMLILHVGRPMAQYQSEQLAQALIASGNRAEVKLAVNKSHRTLNSELGKNGDEPTRWVLEFLIKEKSKSSWHRR